MVRDPIAWAKKMAASAPPDPEPDGPITAAQEAKRDAARRERVSARRPGPECGPAPGDPPPQTDETPPPLMQAETRPDPILPVVRVTEPPERTAGRLAFGGIVNERGDLLDGQLPLFDTPELPRVPILELADVRGGPIMAQGRGAPLDLRLFVGACIMIPYAARAHGRLAVTVRELKEFLFPNGWQRGRDWPRIRDALLRARDYVIPGAFLWEGKTVRNWLPVALRAGVSEDPKLDDVVLLDVELPPGTASGPIIDRRELARLGVESSPRFRAYIAARSVAWLPGTTRVVVPRSGGRRSWSADPQAYPVLTAEDRRRLAFGASDTGNRTRADLDAAWEDLPGVVVDRNARLPNGRSGWRVIPSEAVRSVEEGKT